FVVPVRFQDSYFVRDSDAVVSDSRKDGSARFRGQHLRGKYSGKLAREEFDEQRRHVRRGVCHRCCESSLLANLIKRRKRAIAAYHQVFVRSFAVILSLDQRRCREPRVLQNPLPNQLGDSFWGKGLGKAV